MVCGSCKEVLVRGMRTNQIQNIVFHCSACDAYNETVKG